MAFRLRIVFILVLLSVLGWAQSFSWAQAVPIHLLQVSGTIDQGVSAYLCRGIRQAEQSNAAVLVEITTLGGRVDAAFEAKDCFLSSSVQVFSYVQGRALSAGALIALAATKVAMAPGSSLGAAEPRPTDEKTVSAVRAEFEATAAQRHKDPQIAASMVDKGITIPDLVKEGELLTLSADKAEQVGFADVVAATRTEVLATLLPGVETTIVPVKISPSERLARVVTDPYISSILLTIGFLGLLVEFITPGVGVPGAIGLLSLGLFYGGRLVAGIVGWTVAGMFLIGLVLLLVEALVPGFGVPGILGLVAVLASLFLSYETPAAAVTSLAITAVATVVLGVIAVRSFGHKNSRLRRIVLFTQQSSDEGYVPLRLDKGLLGKEGTAVTALRPAGAIELDGERIDAVSEGPMIAAGSQVRVVKVDGFRVVVRSF